MAKEIQAYLSTGSTLYAILLNSVGQVWNGSAFEAVNGSNWTDYDIPLTESVAGLYTADFPAVVAGVYSYVVYNQAGANPATTDEWTGNGYLEWDGTAVVPLTSRAPAGEYDAELTAIQADLDNPDQYKADVSSLALEATLTAIKGAGWTTETLKAIADAIDALDFSDLTAQQVWEYATRALSSPDDYKADVSGLATSVEVGAIALLGETVVGSYTVQDILKIIASKMVGKATGGGTTTITYRGVDDSNDVIVETVDANGNRSSVVLTV